MKSQGVAFMDIKQLQELGDYIDQLSDDDFDTLLREAGFSFDEKSQLTTLITFPTMAMSTPVQYWQLSGVTTQTVDVSELSTWDRFSIKRTLETNKTEQVFLSTDIDRFESDANFTTDRAA
jgi:hypothetical protein